MDFVSFDLNPLVKFSDEELHAELRRRAAEKKASREMIKRCHQCEFWGSVNVWGDVLENGHLRSVLTPKSSTACCPFHKTKSGKYYRCMPAYTLACEHYSKYCKVGTR